MKLSVTTYSFSQAIAAGKMSFEDSVEKAKELGFDALEISRFAPSGSTLDAEFARAEEMKKRADKIGLPIVAYAVGADLFKIDPEEADEAVDALCRQVDIAQVLGVSVMRHDVCYSQTLHGRTYAFPAMIPVLAKNIRRVADYARARGIRTCSENHGYIAQDSYRLEALIGAVDHPNYGWLCDIGNFACADEDSAQAVSRLAPLAVHCHAKDFRITPNGKVAPTGSFSTRGCNSLLGCVIGEGDIPVKQCLDILKRVGYDGYVTVEFEGQEDCFAAVLRGKNNLKAMLGL